MAFEEAVHFRVTTAFLSRRFVIPYVFEGDGGPIVNKSSSK